MMDKIYRKIVSKTSFGSNEETLSKGWNISWSLFRDLRYRDEYIN